MSRYGFFRALCTILIVPGCWLVAATSAAAQQPEVDLTRDQVEEIVRRSYQYVAMYNVNNKFALGPSNPMYTGGWNRLIANTELADHTLKAIARPNNDTLCVAAMLDLRTEPVIISAPAFDSQYVSLMVTGYDHYVNVPMSTRLGDFSTPSRILLYRERTLGYSGEPIPGVDKIVEMTGDFGSAVHRVMPHVNEPERLHRDFDVFENSLLEVMQLVFKHTHTTFDSADAFDQALARAMDSAVRE